MRQTIRRAYRSCIPKYLSRCGIANELAQMALEFAKEKRLKVEVVCPMVYHFLNKHPEYKPLVRLPTPHKLTA